MKKIALYLIICACALAMAACKKNETPDPTLTAVNIVTYESTTADGSVSTFTFSLPNGDLITLSANWKAPESVKPGQRMLISYTASEYGVSGPVNLIGIVPVAGGAIKEASDFPTCEPLQSVAVSRSGNYIDLRASISFAGDAGEISLYAPDPAADKPVLYVVITPGADNMIDSAPRLLYASWSLESIAGLADKNEIKVSYNDYAGRPQTVVLTRE